MSKEFTYHEINCPRCSYPVRVDGLRTPTEREKVLANALVKNCSHVTFAGDPLGTALKLARQILEESK